MKSGFPSNIHFSSRWPQKDLRLNAVRTFIAIIVGLASASGVFWYQNPDLELKVPEGLVAQVEEQRSVLKQVPESFAEIAATSAPVPATNTTDESTQKENGDRIASEAPADRVSELEKKVHAGINAARATHGASPQLKWERPSGHDRSCTQRRYDRTWLLQA